MDAYRELIDNVGQCTGFCKKGLRGKQILPAGLPFLDIFHAHLASHHFGRDFETAVNYPTSEIFERALRVAEFEIEGKRPRRMA